MTVFTRTVFFAIIRGFPDLLENKKTDTAIALLGIAFAVAVASTLDIGGAQRADLTPPDGACPNSRYSYCSPMGERTGWMEMCQGLYTQWQKPVEPCLFGDQPGFCYGCRNRDGISIRPDQVNRGIKEKPAAPLPGDPVPFPPGIVPPDVPVMNPIPAPLPNTPPKTCFICQYQDFPECGAATSAAACAAAVVPGHSQSQCIWRAGSCISFLKPTCDQRMSESRHDWKRLVTTPINRESFPADCTTRDHFYSGHSHRTYCSGFFNEVQACIDVTQVQVGGPASFNFYNDGCETFRNEDEVHARARQIQASLPPGYTVTVTGHQVISSDACLTPMTITITRETLTTTYGPCSTGNPPICHSRSETIRCMSGGEQRQQICCDSDRFYTGGSRVLTWQMGTTCALPVCGIGNICVRPGIGYECQNVGQAAQTQTCCSTDDWYASDNTMVYKWQAGSTCRRMRCDPNGLCSLGGGSIICEEANGTPRRQECCQNSVGGRRWQLGACSQECIGFSRKYWCSESESDAQSQADSCIQARRQACGDGRFEELGCRETYRDNSYAAGECAVEKRCSYRCTPNVDFAPAEVGGGDW